MTTTQRQPLALASPRAPNALVPVGIFFGVAALLFPFMARFAFWPMSPVYRGVTQANFAGPRWLEAWARYDAGWYRHIAEHGYYYKGDRAQSSVPFFPAYPLVMRGLHNLFGGDLVTWGIPVTFVCGLLTSVLLYRWCSRRFGPKSAAFATLLLCVWPYAFYLYGAVYADAMFLAFVLLAFTFVDAGHPLLAGVAGAIATATRPVGLAVMLGLAAVVWEQRRRRGLSATRPSRDWWVLVSAGGIGAYATYLWVTFGNPAAFAVAEGAPGWNQKSKPNTWLKFEYFTRVVQFRRDGLLYPVSLTIQMLLVVLLVVVAVKSRNKIGMGYTVYAVSVLAIPLIASKDFQGLGRYSLAAFPAFGVLGDQLAQRVRARPRMAILAGSVVLLGVLSSAYGRGCYVS
jgi:Gpi18-like mannosyltransferase